MAKKAASAGQDNLSLDELKIDEFPLEDNALFSDLDNEMRAGGGTGSDPGAALDDLNLDFDVKAEPAPALDAPAESAPDDATDMDLSLDDAPKGGDEAGGLDFDLGESEAAPADAGSDELDLSLGDESAPAAGDAADLDLDLNLDGMSGAEAGLDLDATAGDLDLDGELGAESAAPASGADLDLGEMEQEAPAAGSGAGGEDFSAAPDINLEDMDLELEMPGGRGAGLEDLGETTLEPRGAQVDLMHSGIDASGVIKEFEMPPLADSRGEGGAPEQFEALPDVELPEDDVLHLNLGPELPGAPQPEFTMAPEEPSAGVSEAEEILLGEPIPAERAPARAAVPQDLLLSIPHRLSVQMGAVSLQGRDLRGLAYGSVVQLNRTVGEPVDLLLDGRTIAQGEIVLINGKNLGVRILALNK
jgi:flagellar motor switch protein FliN/FliY